MMVPRQWLGVDKHRSVVVVSVLIVAIFLGVILVFAAENGNCPDKCGKAQKEEVGTETQSKETFYWEESGDCKGSGNCNKVKVPLTVYRDCTVYNIYKECVEMEPCDHTGCAETGDVTKKIISTQMQCSGWAVGKKRP
jgi:hypothetical protein